MKQFLTLCMAAAMTAGSFTASAGITLEQAMQMKSEGKAIKAARNVKSSNSFKPMRKAPAASRFHKMMSEKQNGAMRVPQRITSQGDNIFGYASYTDDMEAKPLGLYEFENTQSTLIWADALVDEYMTSATCLGLYDGTISGYALSTFWGYIFGNAFVQYNFETGEILTYQEQDLESTPCYFQTIALDGKNGVMYGYGIIDNVLAFGSTTLSNPFDYKLIKEVPEDEFCLSLTFNAKEGAIYGVNSNYEFVKIDTEGNQSVQMTLDVPDAAQYLTGIVYDPASDLYYWNINREDYSSAMATIDLKSKTLDVYDELEYGEEYICLMTTDEEVSPLQPKRPVAGAANFYKNSPTGFVTFTLPTEMGDGALIEGNVKYRAYLDGELYTVGAAAAGSEISVNFAAAPDMFHIFGLTAVVDGMESSMASLRAYIGNDTPVAPVNVTITDSQISWDAVTEGIHGGYVDAKAMEYIVALNGEEIGRTSATSFAISLDKGADLQAYTAEVTATCNGLTGESASSNSICVGQALPLPQYIVPTEEQFELSSVLDNNHDDVTWALGNGYIIARYSAPDTRMDDWYFLPKMAFEETGKFYSFTFEVAHASDYYPEEYVEVLLCNEPSPTGVVGEIIGEFSPESSSFEVASGEFRVRQAGDYYIAIHCTSDGDQAGVLARNFTVEDNNITLASPEAVSDLDAEGAPMGELKATVTFTMPTLTLAGEEIDPAKNLKATVSGGVADVTVEGKPGEFMTAEIEAEQGDNKLTVTIADGEFNSPIARTVVYCGYNVPSTPTGIASTTSDDMMSMTITWDAVTTGWIDAEHATEGVIDPADVSYDIMMVIDGYWELLDSGITDTTYTYYYDESITGTPQAMVRIGVVATNSVGDNGYITSSMSILGTPYELPIVEDFESQGFNSQPWITYDIEGTPQYGLYYTNQLADIYADRETISLGIIGSDSGDIGRLGTPRFSTKGASEVTLTLEVSGDFRLPKTTVLAQAGAMDPVEVGTITCDQPGFNLVSVTLPAEFLGKDWVGLFIQCEFEDDDEVLIFDSLSIDNGSGVAPALASDVRIAGGKNQIRVSGLEGSNVTISTLDGRVAAKGVKISNDARFNVEKGIYVVKAGNRNAKVMVK